LSKPGAMDTPKEEQNASPPQGSHDEAGGREEESCASSCTQAQLLVPCNGLCASGLNGSCVVWNVLYGQACTSSPGRGTATVLCEIQLSHGAGSLQDVRVLPWAPARSCLQWCSAETQKVLGCSSLTSIHSVRLHVQSQHGLSMDCYRALPRSNQPALRKQGGTCSLTLLGACSSPLAAC
jgi:hypothetical protein